MGFADPIKHTGHDPAKDMAKMAAAAPPVISDALDLVADDVARGARRRVAKRTGKAAATVKAIRTATGASVVGGGPSAPYYGWLDYGGKVGRKRSVSRPYVAGGRYIGAEYRALARMALEALEDTLETIGDKAGVDVDG